MPALGAGSRWSNKRALDEDRPLGRGMRIKQEPAHIQDPAMLTGATNESQLHSNCCHAHLRLLLHCLSI